jgi:hypothetical protein
MEQDRGAFQYGLFESVGVGSCLMQLKLVTFHDPTAYDPWCDCAELLKPLTCQAVGFVIHEDEDKIVLAQVASDQGETACNYVIPKGSIRAVTNLRSIQESDS